jgi:hypothetical protein
MSGLRLFKPNESLDVPNPSDTKQEVGNIVNPPNYAQFGGLDKPKPRGLGISKYGIGIKMPGSTIKDVPQRNRKG